MDYKNALVLFYIVMIGRFFENFLSCDLQRLFDSSVEIKHFLAIISVFFLLTSIDTSMKLTDAARNTIIVYILYILSSKSKAYTVIPMLVLLSIDQLLKVYVDTNKDAKDELTIKLSKYATYFRNALTFIILVLIFGGALFYLIRAQNEFGDKFSYRKFILGTGKCANV